MSSNVASRLLVVVLLVLEGMPLGTWAHSDPGHEAWHGRGPAIESKDWANAPTPSAPPPAGEQEQVQWNADCPPEFLDHGGCELDFPLAIQAPCDSDGSCDNPHHHHHGHAHPGREAVPCPHCTGARFGPAALSAGPVFQPAVVLGQLLSPSKDDSFTPAPAHPAAPRAPPASFHPGPARLLQFAV
jgi:hypothetical protein